MPIMSGAITVNRCVSVGQISDQSHELNGYPWMRSRFGPVPGATPSTR